MGGCMYELMNVYLENGLKVVLHKVPSAKTVACGVWVKQGSRYEDEETSGLSHLLEHLIITSKNNDTNDNFLDEITSKGIMYNATTMKEYTSYYFSGILQNLELCLSTLSKLIIDFGSISDEIFENEKKIVEREAIGYYSSFKQIGERSSQALWGNAGIGRIIVGEVDNIKRTTKSEIVDLYNKRYTPENSTLVVVGGFEYNEVLSIIKSHFSRWKDRPTFKIEESINKDPGIYLNTQDGGENSILSVCFRLPPFGSPDRNDIEVMALILGDGGVKSRLAKEIRMKRGLAYIINSFESFYEDRGMLGFASVCAHSTVKEVAKLMMEEFVKCREHGFTEAEIEGAKNKLITKRILGLENVSDHLKYLGKCACYNSMFSLEQEIRNINLVNAESLNKVLNEILTESNMGLAAIGDFDVDELLEVVTIS